MGCCQTTKSYFNINNADEKEIRRFEKKIGGFSIDFSVVHQRISYDNDSLNPGSVARILQESFSAEFTNVIKDEFFYKKDSTSQLDAAKIINLIFLVSSQGTTSNQYSSFPDKAYYFYMKCKSAEEEDLSKGLSKDSGLLETLKKLIEVSLGFAKVYFKISSSEERGITLMATDKIDQIAEYIAGELFKVKDKEVDVLSFNELKEKFSSDPYFFAGGYFREKAVEFLQQIMIKDKLK